MALGQPVPGPAFPFIQQKLVPNVNFTPPNNDTALVPGSQLSRVWGGGLVLVSYNAWFYNAGIAPSSIRIWFGIDETYSESQPGSPPIPVNNGLTFSYSEMVPIPPGEHMFRMWAMQSTGGTAIIPTGSGLLMFIELPVTQNVQETILYSS